MKKVALFATAFIFSFAVMAQTEKTQPAATKVPRSLTSKTKNEAPPVKEKEIKPTVETVQTTPGQTSPDDVIKMNVLKHDFGKIPQGKPVTYAFEIKNISKTAIVVENTTATCGCTVPEKIVEPIAPGASAKLKVQYNAASVGPFTKDVHIKLAGIDQPKTVTIVGEVLAPEPPKESKPNN